MAHWSDLPAANLSESAWDELLALSVMEHCWMARLRRVIEDGLGRCPPPALLRAAATALYLLADEIDARAES